MKSSNWGSGWQVGVRKAIWRHEKTLELAAEILAAECGTRHKTGEHELCPKCKEFKQRGDGTYRP